MGDCFSRRVRLAITASILYLMFAPCSLSAQNWTDNIFTSLSGQYYVFPGIAGAISPSLADQYGVSKGVVPFPGFRAGAGYELGRWNFALESGFTYILGDNPLVEKINLSPLLFKAGYSFFPIKKYNRFSLTLVLGAGLFFGWVDHYQDVIDMLTGKITHSKNTGFLAQAGARAGWQPVLKWGKAFELNAGFSLDMIVETGGLIPLPQIELGIIVRPWRFLKLPGDSQLTGTLHSPDEAEAVDGIEESDGFLKLTEELIGDPDIARQVWLVLFPPNGATPTAAGLAVLDKAGDAMRAALSMGGNIGKDSKFRVIIGGFAAPFLTAAGQREISRRRAVYCRDYLVEKYGVPESMIIIGWYGSERLPENNDAASHPERRSVEIIFSGWDQ